MLRKIKSDWFFCVFSALLFILPFAYPYLWIFAWVGFVPLFFTLEKKSKLQAFKLSYLTGIIFWSGIIYWLVHVTLVGTALLILYLALYFGLFGLFISCFKPRAMGDELLFIASLWTILEYGRSHLLTGFPWALLAYSQTRNLPIIQIADITGAWGVSFLVVMVNTLIWQLIKQALATAKWPVKIKKAILPILCLVISLGYGYYRMHQRLKLAVDNSLKICVIQGNIAQELKWDVRNNDFIMNKYLDLSKQAALDSPDLFIWPEAALPVILEEDPRFFAKALALAEETKIPLALGAVTKRGDLYYNSALLVSSHGQLLTRYDKLHLVPFGEYIPLKHFFPFLESIVPIGDISAGKDYTIFKIPSPKIKDDLTIKNSFAVLICFEDLFPELSRHFVQKGAKFLVNITNDAWYKKTAASYQHFQASVFRAVENRVSLVRSANTGISGFIRPDGEIISLVQDEFGRDIFVDGYLTQEISIPDTPLTFYTRYGDVFIVICFILFFVILIRCSAQYLKS